MSSAAKKGGQAPSQPTRKALPKFLLSCLREVSFSKEKHFPCSFILFLNQHFPCECPFRCDPKLLITEFAASGEMNLPYGPLTSNFDIFFFPLTKAQRLLRWTVITFYRRRGVKIKVLLQGSCV